MPKKPKEPQASASDSPLSEAQRRAVVLIAEGATGRSVADTLGLSEYTISRWKQSADFEAAVNQLLQDARDGAVNRLRNMATTALDTIEQVLTDFEASPSDRLKAAGMVLDAVQLTRATPTIGPVNAERIERDLQNEAQHQAVMDALASPWG